MRKLALILPVVLVLMLLAPAVADDKPRLEGKDRPEASQPKSSSGVRIIINGKELPLDGKGPIVIREREGERKADGDRKREGEREREGERKGPPAEHKGESEREGLYEGVRFFGSKAAPPGDKKYGFLGVVPGQVGPALAAQLELEDGRGVVADEVAKDSPAAKAGIVANDVIVKVDDQIIYSVEQIQKLIAARKPGSTVRIEFIHKAKLQSARVELGGSAIASWKQHGPGQMGCPMMGQGRCPMMGGQGPDIVRRLLPLPGPNVMFRALPEQGNEDGQQFNLFPRRPDGGNEPLHCPRLGPDERKCPGPCRPECPHQAKQPPGQDLSRLIEPLRDKLPPAVFGELREIIDRLRDRLAEERERALDRLDEPAGPQARDAREQAERIRREFEERFRGLEREREQAIRRLREQAEQAHREAERRLDEHRREGERREGDQPRPPVREQRSESEARVGSGGETAAHASVSAQSENYRATWEHRRGQPARISLFNRQTGQSVFENATPDELPRLTRDLNKEARQLLELVVPCPRP